MAVTAVLLFHGGVAWARGGFLGVDAFFVLSGYLITTLLLAEWRRTGRIDILAFWGRRARRLLPALVLVTAAVTMFAHTLLPPGDVGQLRGDAFATLFYFNNWQLAFTGDDYFARTAAPSPLEHTWSLGIEEQFYLLWPLVLVPLLGFRAPLRRLLAICIVGAVLSAVAMALLHAPGSPGRAYYGTDTRGGSLLVGAALAAALALPRARSTLSDRRIARSVLGMLAAGGAALTLWGWTHLAGDDGRLYGGGFAVTAVAVAALLAHVAIVPEGLTARVLSVWPLPVLGRISYGVYLWHFPVFIAVNSDRTQLQGTALLSVRCLVTIVLASLSYLLVERPVRSGRLLRRPSIAAVGAVTGMTACTLLVMTQTAPAALPVGTFTAESLVDGVDGLGGIYDDFGTAGARQRGLSVDDPRGEVSTASPRSRPVHQHHQRAGRPVVVDVFGDSVAWSLAVNLPHHPRLDIRDRSMLGCGVTLAAPYRYFGHTYPTVWRSCLRWVRLWERAVLRDDPDVVLILVGRWETMDRVLDGRWTHVGDAAFNAHLRQRLDRAISIAGSHGAKVLLATEPYNRRGEQADGSLFPEDRPERVTAWNELLRSVAVTHQDVEVLDLGGRISPNGTFSWTAGGLQMRTDGLHLTPEGVSGWVAPWLFPRLLAAAPG